MRMWQAQRTEIFGEERHADHVQKEGNDFRDNHVDMPTRKINDHLEKVGVMRRTMS